MTTLLRKNNILSLHNQDQIYQIGTVFGEKFEQIVQKNLLRSCFMDRYRFTIAARLVQPIGTLKIATWRSGK